MSSTHTERSTWIILPTLSLLLYAVSGCGPTRVSISHTKLDEITNKRQGSILVKRFVDKRPPAKKIYIGNKRNGFGAVVGHVATLKDVSLEDVLTEHFAEALREAGYEATIDKAKSGEASSAGHHDAVLTGQINEFWLDLYMGVWHNVNVKTKLMSKDMQRSLWERDIKGNEKNALLLGSRGEFAKVIRQALTKALNQAATEFASDDFFQAATAQGT